MVGTRSREVPTEALARDGVAYLGTSSAGSHSNGIIAFKSLESILIRFGVRPTALLEP